MHDINRFRYIGSWSQLGNLRRYYSIYWNNIYAPHIDFDKPGKCDNPPNSVLRLGALPTPHNYQFFVAPEDGFYFIHARFRYKIQRVPTANVYTNVPVNSKLVLVRGYDDTTFYRNEDNFDFYNTGRWSVLNCDTLVVNAQQLAEILNLDFSITGYPVTTIELVGSDIIYLLQYQLFTVLFNFDSLTAEPCNIMIEEAYIDIYRITDTTSVAFDPCEP
jgi:hypothetical protein